MIVKREDDHKEQQVLYLEYKMGYAKDLVDGLEENRRKRDMDPIDFESDFEERGIPISTLKSLTPKQIRKQFKRR